MTGEYPLMLGMIARKKSNARAIISVSALLSEGEKWFDRLYKREPGLLKVVLIP